MRITELLIELTKKLQSHGDLEVEVMGDSIPAKTHPIGIPCRMVKTDENKITKVILVI